MNPTLTALGYLEQALAMAARGARIVFYPSVSKACTLSKWQELATTDAEAITAMAEANPSWTNYACVAKAVEDGLIIFDDDSGIRGEYEKIYGPFPMTLKVRSFSGKFHYYFRHSARSIAYQQALGKAYIGEKKPDGEKGELWSLRMHNSYCVGPGSVVTENGKTGEYAVAYDAEVSEITDTVLQFCRERYEAAEKREREAAPATTVQATRAEALSSAGTKEPKTKKDWQREINSDEPIGDGERNVRLTSIGGYLRRVMKFEETMINATLQDINSRRCVPALPSKDVSTIAHSVASYKNGEDRKTVQVEKEDVNDIKGLVRLLLYTEKKERAASGLDIPENGEEAANFASQVIYDHLQTRGKFFYADNVGYILLDGQEDKPVCVSEDDAQFCQMLSDYGVNPGQDKQYKVGKFIWMKVKTMGQVATKCFSSHYNAETKCFYFAEQPGKLIRASAERIDRVPNGTDGELFFYDDKAEPLTIDLESLPKFRYSLLAGPDSLLTKYLFQDLVFADSAMSPEGKKILITTYIMLLILAGIVKDRPMLQMIGESGTGKTFFLRLLGRLIVGTTFDVHTLPDDKNQFENVLINNSLAFFDNVDDVPKPLRSLFCAACTGFQIVRRVYYTTAEQMLVSSKATLGLSALVPVLVTSEQTNRSMVFHLLERGNGNLDETTLLNRFDAQRKNLVAEILVRAQMVLQALKAQETYEPRVEGRLAGVGTLILRVARHEGWEAVAESLLESWNEEQLQGALQGDDVADTIQKWITQENWQPQVLTAAELVSAFRIIFTGEPSWKNSAMSLSKTLLRSRKAYAHRFGLIVTEDKHAKVTLFCFKPSPEQMMMLKAGTHDPDDTDPTPGGERALGSPSFHGEIYKPGDYEPAEPWLNHASIAAIPDDLEEGVKEGIVKWAKVLVTGGWGGGAMDVTPTRAVILFAKNVAGKGGFDSPAMSLDDWQDAFGEMQEIHEQGGEGAIQACLNGHSPTRGGGGYWCERMQTAWKAAAITPKGEAAIRRTYGADTLTDRIKEFMYSDVDL